MIVAKLHKRGNELVLAACDADLVGKTLNAKNGAQVYVNPAFYSGETVTRERLSELISDATIINLFGKETVSLAIEKRHCSKENTIEIAGIPHGQIVKMF